MGCLSRTAGIVGGQHLMWMCLKEVEQLPSLKILHDTLNLLINSILSVIESVSVKVLCPTNS